MKKEDIIHIKAEQCLTLEETAIGFHEDGLEGCPTCDPQATCSSGWL